MSKTIRVLVACAITGIISYGAANAATINPGTHDVSNAATHGNDHTL